jgi:hypothetical protein
VKPKTPEEFDQDEELHRVVLSVEDMIARKLAPEYCYTGYRWFASPNVIDLFKILQKRGGLRGRFRLK